MSRDRGVFSVGSVFIPVMALRGGGLVVIRVAVPSPEKGFRRAVVGEGKVGDEREKGNEPFHHFILPPFPKQGNEMGLFLIL